MRTHSRNVTIYLYYTLFTNLIILGPIIIIYLAAKGLSFSEIMLLNSIASIAVFLFEVPTGSIADKVGRKFSLIVGTSLWVVQLVLLIFAKSFAHFALAQLLMALGITFMSGANSALLYDSLKADGREAEFQKMQGRANSWVYYGQAIGCVAAGFLYELNMELPVIISAVNAAIAVIIATRFVEPPIEDKPDKEGYLKHIADSGRFVMQHNKVKALVVYGTVFYVFYRVGFYFFQPYFQAVNLDVRYYGIFFALFNIVAALTSQNAHKIISATKGRTLTVLSATMIVSFGLMAMVTTWIGAFGILLQQVARGLYSPVIQKFMHKHIPSNKRATIVSLYSLVISLASALAYPIFGAIGERYTVFTTHGIMFLSMLVLTVLSLSYYGRITRRKGNAADGSIEVA